MLTGKSTIGKALAAKLGKSFIEMDAEVEVLSGQSIFDLFQKGEEYFRDWEEKACQTIAKRRNSVIACGGGVILRKRNIESLQKTSVIVFLKTSPEVIYQRFLASATSSRPLLNRNDPLGEIHRLLRNREALYEKSAAIHINASNSIITVVDNVIQKLQMIE